MEKNKLGRDISRAPCHATDAVCYKYQYGRRCWNTFIKINIGGCNWFFHLVDVAASAEKNPISNLGHNSYYCSWPRTWNLTPKPGPSHTTNGPQKFIKRNVLQVAREAHSISADISKHQDRAPAQDDASKAGCSQEGDFDVSDPGDIQEAWTKWWEKEQEQDNTKQRIAEPWRNCVLAETAVRSSSRGGPQTWGQGDRREPWRSSLSQLASDEAKTECIIVARNFLMRWGNAWKEGWCGDRRLMCDSM